MNKPKEIDPQTVYENRRRLAHEAAVADLKRLEAEGGDYWEILAAREREERLSYAE